VGYICGDQLLAKSRDGGLTWIKINLPDSLNGLFLQPFFWMPTLAGWFRRPSIIKTSNEESAGKKL
jgi:hypothetical protein